MLSERLDVEFLKPARKRGWLQFSLGSVLLLVFLAACVSAVWSYFQQPLLVENEAIEQLQERIEKKRPRFFPEQPLATEFRSVPWFGRKKHVKVLKKADFCVRVDNGQDWDVYQVVLGDDDLKLLGQCSQLRHLDLEGSVVTDAGLEHLQHLLELRHLDLSETQVQGEGLKYIAHLPRLEKLILSGLTLSGDDLARLGKSPSLRSIKGGAVVLQPGQWKTLLANQNLRSITFENAQAPKMVLGETCALQELEIGELNTGSLSIVGPPLLSKLSLGGEIEQIEVRRAPRLKVISVRSDAKASGSFLVADLPELESLQLLGHALVTSIRSCPKLAFANIGGINNEEGLFHDVEQLQRLHLFSDSPLSTGILQEVCEAKDLKQLWIGPLRETVSFAGLSSLKQLDQLAMGVTHMTDELDQQIAEMKNLKSLRLWGLQCPGRDLGEVVAGWRIEQLTLQEAVIGSLHLRSHPTLKRLWTTDVVIGSLVVSDVPNLTRIDNRDLTVKSIKLEKLPTVYDVEFGLRQDTIVDEVWIDSLPKVTEIQFTGYSDPRNPGDPPRIPSQVFAPDAQFPRLGIGSFRGYRTNGCVVDD